MTSTSHLMLQTQHHQLCLDINVCFWAWSTAAPVAKVKNMKLRGDVKQGGVEVRKIGF
jgi:hypothetical protein